MDFLWSPWRYNYVTKSDGLHRCIFCEKQKEDSGCEDFVIFRGRLSFVLLNVFPYSAGHVMIAPYAHVGTLAAAGPAVMNEVMALTVKCEGHLRAIYKAPGYNIGMNIGSCAGAGIADHIHMHVLPRWPGDVNFMTAIAETRVLPEALQDSYRKLVAAFGDAA